jgi:hypothetical protein
MLQSVLDKLVDLKGVSRPVALRRIERGLRRISLSFGCRAPRLFARGGRQRPIREEGGRVEPDRFEELKRKAAGEGLTDEEAAELGRLYAEERGEPYQDSSSVSDDASSEDRESQERRKREAAAKAKAAAERDRTQAIPPGEAREPDYK